jgi:uncharacterized membrane-anchored protein YhcB (DUF1043 family)
VESIDPVWLFSGIALVIGFILGAIIQMLLNPKASDIEKLKSELELARSEMEQYKSNVNRHFNKTSDLVNELTQDYVKVYQHLAEGAQTLSNTAEFAQVLEQSQGRVLISVEDDSAGSEGESDAVVAEPADETSAASTEPTPTNKVDAADAEIEAALTDDERLAQVVVDEAAIADDNRPDPVIGDSLHEAENDPVIEPAAEQDPAEAQKAESDPAKKT